MLVYWWWCRLLILVLHLNLNLLIWNQNQVELSSHTLQILNWKWQSDFPTKERLPLHIAMNPDPGLLFFLFIASSKLHTCKIKSQTIVLNLIAQFPKMKSKFSWVEHSLLFPYTIDLELQLAERFPNKRKVTPKIPTNPDQGSHLPKI